MDLKIFSIYDEKAKAYFPPQFQPQIGQAIRTFTDIVNNPETQLHKHPEDYSLYHIGSFNDDNAKLESLNEPQFLARASEVIKKPMPELINQGE